MRFPCLIDVEIKRVKNIELTVTTGFQSEMTIEMSSNNQGIDFEEACINCQDSQILSEVT